MTDMLVWLGIFAVAVGALAASHAATLPYAKRAIWGAAAALATLGALVLLRRRHTTAGDAWAGGQTLAEKGIEALGNVVDTAQEAQAQSDAELTAALLTTEEEKAAAAAEIAAIKLVDDSMARRRALIALAAKHKRS